MVSQAEHERVVEDLNTKLTRVNAVSRQVLRAWRAGRPGELQQALLVLEIVIKDPDEATREFFKRYGDPALL